jgi:teichuronic acid biosynthesis glycosyltransferase TuaC
MRVLAVTNMYPTPEFPSSGTFVEQQILGLKRIGLDVHVMCVDRLEKGMIAYASLPGELRSRIAASQPDLVHSLYGGIMADLVTRIVNDRPTMVTFHGSDLLGQPLAGPLRKFIARYGTFASRKAARRCNGIVIVSKCLQRVLPTDIDSSKIRIIPCGIPLDIFKPLNRATCCESLGWELDRFHVLFYKSDDPVKRPSLAYAAIECVKLLGIKAELHELHQVPYAEVPMWLNASDALLLTSIHEGSPTIVKEALACNLPIVSVGVGDIRERIDGIEGCYLALPEPSDLGAKLYLIASHMGRIEGRARVQDLSLEHIALRLEHFYREVLESYSHKNWPNAAVDRTRTALGMKQLPLSSCLASKKTVQ